MKIALIQDGLVERIIIGELTDFPGWIDVTGKFVGVGFTDNGDGTFTDNTPPEVESVIRTITMQAFFRRLTKNERSVLRASTLDEVADLREDLQRSVTVDLDGTIEQQLLDTTLLSQTRISQLLIDGEEHEI